VRRPELIRPANYPEGCPGRELHREDEEGCAGRGDQSSGPDYMPNTDCPFRKADAMVAALDPAVR